jgi:hypothetical protein
MTQTDQLISLFGDLAVATAVVDDIVVLQFILYLTLLEVMPIPKADTKFTFQY